MSYDVTGKFHDVVIPKDKFGECLGAVYKVTREDLDGEEDLMPRKNSLRGLFEHWGIYTRPGPKGGMILDYTEEGFDGSHTLFEAIAPFVADSDTPPSVECIGEDGDRWRYLFVDGKAIRQHPEITWVNDG